MKKTVITGLLFVSMFMLAGCKAKKIIEPYREVEENTANKENAVNNIKSSRPITN